nr:erythroblast NAD(P)(+)--arginine ADP-ribosyltransferase-like [Zonotrichia albicollis]
MAFLAKTLALLAMAMATAADEVKPLDMAEDSFDDQYQGCGPDMTAALLALNRSEFKQNKKFAEVWVKAAAEWPQQAPSGSHEVTDQDIALMAFSMDGLHSVFNDAVRVAGRSSQEYRDNFHFKTLHFLLTDALAVMRKSLQGVCYDGFLQVCGIRFEAQRGDKVRFGEFIQLVDSKQLAQCSGKETVFTVNTCHSAGLGFKIGGSQIEYVLIPPFETFKVIEIAQEGDKTNIQLRSTGTYSKYNCEWLRGDIAGDSLGGMGTLSVAMGTPLIRWECSQCFLPRWRTPPGHHSPGSGNRDPLSHKATKVTVFTVVTVATKVTVVIVATMIT